MSESIEQFRRKHRWYRLAMTIAVVAFGIGGCFYKPEATWPIIAMLTPLVVIHAIDWM